ncbi:hypothetical protein PHISCL_11100 [Aspergillus sclerotialis]|uniref:Uncharacterized protein n=1 Tax=Aspergillus sclerotialis TaxID=2070753 RepID=A0A3A2Z2X8_9EURO|nr:hypothetical protein PHISCL_11100 [Aspergillus sclerotialis]
MGMSDPARGLLLHMANPDREFVRTTRQTNFYLNGLLGSIPTCNTGTITNDLMGVRSNSFDE